MVVLSRNTRALRWRWLLPAAAALLLFHLTPLGVTLDRAFFDAASRRPLRRDPIPAGSAIVLMDNATMDALSQKGFGGTWPPPRATFAGLVTGLHRAGAARIVLDFVFLDHSTAQEQDLFLGAVSAALPSVVLGRTATQTPAFWDQKFVAANAPLFAASMRVGHAEVPPDSDGVIRSYRTPGSLAAAALNTPVTNDGGLLRWHGNVTDLQRGDAPVPVLSAANFIVAGMHSVSRLLETAPDLNFQATILAQALAAEEPLRGEGFEAVRGRTVFVGVSATGGFDLKTFPVGGTEPGVLVHWTAWSNLVGRGFIQPLAPPIAPALAIVVLGALAALGSRQTGIVRPILTALAVAAGVLGLSYAGLSWGWFLPPALPVMAAGFAFTGLAAEKFWTEHRRRQEVQTMFGSYVAPEVVDLLVRDPSAIRLGGEKREATVFFCDLAGFTDLSEKVTPEELLELVNGYLQETSDCLLEHGAYIDKYIGDAVMAVFGAPLPQPGHALAACRGALAAQRMLAERNRRLAVTHGRVLGMRIGINTGQMIVGNLGSARKRNYTVLGDTVNLASRLEGANKEFGTSILLGEATARLVRDELVLRPLTALRVKGKATAVDVFELVGEKSTVTPLQHAFLAAYGQGHALYTARRFSEAVSAFAAAAALAPDDSMTAALLAEARELAAHPPTDAWEPILSLKTK